jgi:hypothetical protein
MPRHFVTAANGISTLLILTGGHRPFLSVNVIWTDFVCLFLFSFFEPVFSKVQMVLQM